MESDPILIFLGSRLKSLSHLNDKHLFPTFLKAGKSKFETADLVCGEGLLPGP